MTIRCWIGGSFAFTTRGAREREAGQLVKESNRNNNNSSAVVVVDVLVVVLCKTTGCV